MGSIAGLPPTKLLRRFEELAGKVSRPLISKDSNAIINPPLLLPGETLILQQGNVTCLNTLSSVAVGSLHLTNYRIVFTGSIIQEAGSHLDLDIEELARLGYKYQKRKHLLPRVRPQLKKWQSSVGKQLIKRSFKENVARRFQAFRTGSGPNSYDLCSVEYTESIVVLKKQVCDTLDDEEADCNELQGASPEVVISIPILSIFDVKKFPKQFLDHHKLLMLNDGIEVVTTNFLSVKMSLGDDASSYDADELILRLLKLSRVRTVSSIFAYVYARGVILPENLSVSDCQSLANCYSLEAEVNRLQPLSSSDWKLTDQNCCSCYPKNVIVPRNALCGDALHQWSKFYRNGCFPVVSWRNASHGNVLMRSAGTVTPRGFIDGRCQIDEELLRDISLACTTAERKNLTIFTDKQAPAAVQANGLSVKEGETYYYPHCSVVLLENLPELRATQQCGMKLVAALSRSDELRLLSDVEESGWLQEISVLLDYAVCVVSAMESEHSSVLLSLASGTERVAQLSCLVQLLVDPYYRSMEGFQILIQKEWLEIRHPFMSRHLICFSGEEELCPLFLQFLDCVWQLMRQFPTSFEINELMLEFLCEHAYSGRFDTFIQPNELQEPGISIWTYITVANLAQDQFFNFNYDPSLSLGILQPLTSVVHLEVWSWFDKFRKNESLFMAEMIATMQLEKLQSECRDLTQLYSDLLANLPTSASRQGSTRSDRSGRLALLSNSSLESDLCDFKDTLSVVSRTSSLSSVASDSNFKLRLAIQKSRSVEDLLAFTSDAKREKVPTVVGRSKFYPEDNRASTGASVLKELHSATLPVNWKPSERFHSLGDYLLKNGVPYMDHSEVVIKGMTCCGFLVKRGNFHKNWKRRWFVLDWSKRLVAYFESENTDLDPKGVFSCMTIKRVRPYGNHKRHQHLFLVETLDRTYFVKAADSRVMDIWITCLGAPLSSLVL